jgi:hypothetical protein
MSVWGFGSCSEECSDGDSFVNSCGNDGRSFNVGINGFDLSGNTHDLGNSAWYDSNAARVDVTAIATWPIGVWISSNACKRADLTGTCTTVYPGQNAYFEVNLNQSLYINDGAPCSP